MESDYYKTVIKNYREKEDLTQEALSEKLGCDQTYISQLERGKRTPSVDFFISFSNVSKIPIDYILCSESKIGTDIKINEITERANKLAPKDKQLVFSLLDTLIDRFENDNKE